IGALGLRHALRGILQIVERQQDFGCGSIETDRQRSERYAGKRDRESEIKQPDSPPEDSRDFQGEVLHARETAGDAPADAAASAIDFGIRASDQSTQLRPQPGRYRTGLDAVQIGGRLAI